MKVRSRRPRKVIGARAARQPLAEAVRLYREEARQSIEQWLDSEARAAASSVRFRAFYEDAPVGYFRLDRYGAIVDLNQTATRMLGGTKAHVLVGKPLIAFVVAADTKKALQHTMRCRDGEPVVTTTLRLVRVHAVRTVQLVSTRAVLLSGELEFDTIVTDVSQQAAAEEAVRDRERQYRSIVETANEGICITDREARITFLNQRFARMLGGDVEMFAGRQLTDFVPDDKVEAVRAQLQSDFGRTGVQELQLCRLNRTVLWTLVSSSAVVDANGVVTGVLRMFTDISDRKELEATRARLVRHLVAAQEAERHRIARDLHDQTGQHLVGLTLGLDRLAQRTAADAEARQIVARLREITAGLARDAHSLAVELRPSALDDLGLSAAVSNYADAISTRTGLHLDVHCDVASRLDPAIETTVYRVVQEALTNVIRHASANQVSIIIERQPMQLRVVVEDDGVGFDVGQALIREGGGLGIVGMRERATLVGGELTLESSEGHGTTLFLRVPLRDEGLPDDEEIAGPAGR